MKNRYRLLNTFVLLMIFSCGQDTGLTVQNSVFQEILPNIRLAKSLSISEVDSAVVFVTMENSKDTLSFALGIDRSSSKLYGKIEIPQDAKSVFLDVRMYDSKDRKIGQGYCRLTAEDISRSRYVSEQIDVNSAKPRIDSIAAPGTVGANQIIRFKAFASDSFGGKVVKYEWKFDSADWVETKKDSLIVVAPVKAQAHICTLRVTDDDGNAVVGTVTVEVIHYKVMLDKQSGNGGTDSVMAIYNESMPEAAAPTRSGYSFKGYYDSISGGTQYYSDKMEGRRKWNKAHNFRLYAHWLSKTYMVKLDKRLGGGGADSVKVTYDAEMPAATKPAREGYTFAGYWDSTSGGTQYYSNSMSSSNNWDKAQNTTLYARWTGKSYAVLFNKQNGTEGSDSVRAVMGSGMPSATAPKRAGYTFTGYFDAKIDGAQYYTAEMVSTQNWDKAEKTTLYARWTGNSYTVTLNMQSGNGGTAQVAATYSAAMPTATAPAREGYTFTGYWDSTSGGTQYFSSVMASARTWDKAQNTTLYARWEANNYTVKFNKQSGMGGSDSVKATMGLAMPVATAPTREGYTFTGYWDSTSGGTQYYSSSMSSSNNWNKGQNTTLYARWTGKSYTVLFNKQNGTGGSDSVRAFMGSSMPSATAPKRTGYSFTGYFDAKIDGVWYYTAHMGSMRKWDKAEKTTLYAHWTVNSYTVKLDKQSGNGGTDEVAATYGAAMPEATAPAREGYTFTGYWDSTSGGTQYFSSVMASARTWDKAQNTTLYARWEANNYTVKFNKQNGTGGSDSVKVTFGEAMPAAEPPTRNGYYFAGYWTAEHEGIRYYFHLMESANNWNIPNNAELFAQWIPNVITDADGNEYSTVLIGNQIWTVENLRTTKYNDGTPIPNVTDDAEWAALTTPGYCYHNNTTDADTIKKWGALYNWYVVSPTNPEKIAPEGWRVPTDTDWTVLEEYLIANGYNWDGTTSENKIAKSLAAQTDWYTLPDSVGKIGNDLSKNNASGFSALPGGSRQIAGFFMSIGSIGVWWSATETEYIASFARDYQLNSYYEGLGWNGEDKSFGNSVRLLRDLD
ncbi:MAG: hypothetical protein GX556_12175 [Fibrobacter sp.]|nr:hypothetical protein [Fibrobacter sp.]